MFCRKCGNEIPGTSRYCGKCGTKVISSEEMAAHSRNVAYMTEMNARMMESPPFTYENYAKKRRIVSKKQTQELADTQARLIDLFSLFTGCGSLFLCKIPLVSIPLSLAGLILGIIGLSSNRPSMQNILGIILSVFGIFATAIVLLLSLSSMLAP